MVIHIDLSHRCTQLSLWAGKRSITGWYLHHAEDVVCVNLRILQLSFVESISVWYNSWDFLFPCKKIGENLFETSREETTYWLYVGHRMPLAVAATNLC